MISPGLIVALASVAVLLQICVVLWVMRDIRGLEKRLTGRMDQFDAKATAMTMLAQETLSEARKALDRLDQRELASVGKTELEYQLARFADKRGD